jgi:hypothetical protein
VWCGVVWCVEGWETLGGPIHRHVCSGFEDDDYNDPRRCAFGRNVIVAGRRMMLDLLDILWSRA